MSGEAFTPGPWHTYLDGSGIAGPGGQPIAWIFPSGATGTENARLIAAAPEMVDAGNALSAYVYALVNPGQIPEHVKAAMQVFEALA